MWLLERRSITCIGVDTLSLDRGTSETFEVHGAVLGGDKYGLENLANLDRIPPRGARAFVGLVPWEEGSGGPCRVIAHFEWPCPKGGCRWTLEGHLWGHSFLVSS